MSKFVAFEYIGEPVLIQYLSVDEGSFKSFSINKGQKLLGHALYYEGRNYYTFESIYNIFCIPYNCLLREPNTIKKFSRIRSVNSLIKTYYSLNLATLVPLFAKDLKLDTENKKLSLDVGKSVTQALAEQRLLAEEREKINKAAREQRNANTSRYSWFTTSTWTIPVSGGG